MRRVVQYALIVLISVSITVVLAEIGLRQFDPVSNMFIMRTDGPVAEYTSWGPSLSPDGAPLCDWPHDFQNKDGRTRVLLLGDSVLDCNLSNQPFNGTVPYFLQQALGPGYEVINLSAGGWGNDQQLLAYLSYGRRYDPDIVLMFFMPSNDIYNNTSKTAVYETRGKPYFTLDEDGELVLHKEKIEGGAFPMARLLLRTEIGKRIFLLKRSSEYKDSLGYEEGFSHISSYIVPASARIEQGWDITEAIIRRLKAETSASGSAFAVVYIPAGLDIGKHFGILFGPSKTSCVGFTGYNIHIVSNNGKVSLDILSPYRRLQSVLAAEDIDLVDNIESVKPYANNHLNIAYDCYHLSKTGSKMLAEKVAAHVRVINSSR